MAKPLSGHEPATEEGNPIGVSVLDFWRWSASDLLSNATRGVFAEFLVAKALGVPCGRTRDEWAPWDLTTDSGIKVEVKSAAYVQSWDQLRPSAIQFVVSRPKGLDGEPLDRPSDVYVFALLAHEDKATINPLEVSQWRFFVLSARALDARERSQHSITLPSLRKLAGEPIPYRDLQEAVALAAGKEAGPFAGYSPKTTTGFDAVAEQGPWCGRVEDHDGKMRVFLESGDFTHDARLYVDGDFASLDQKLAYAHEIARRLNAPREEA